MRGSESERKGKRRVLSMHGRGFDTVGGGKACLMKDKRNRTNKGESNLARNGLTDKLVTSARPIVTVDVERYQAWFDAADLSAAQKEQFTQSLWFIVMTFVELGFGVHPLHAVYGQNSANGAVGAKKAFDAVESKKADHIRPSTYSSPQGVLEAE